MHFAVLFGPQKVPLFLAKPISYVWQLIHSKFAVGSNVSFALEFYPAAHCIVPSEWIEANLTFPIKTSQTITDQLYVNY